MELIGPKVFRGGDVHLPASATGGGFFAARGSGQAGAPTPLHLHRRSDEFIFVLGGVLAVTVSGEREALRAGEAVWLPRGHAHRFEIVEDAQWLVVGSGGYEAERDALNAAVTEGATGAEVYAGLEAVEFVEE